MDNSLSTGLVGIHSLVLLEGIDSKEFEKFMTEEVFPAAAETPGSVSRGGQSTILSQHLLSSNGETNEYLWLVKNSGVFHHSNFGRVFERMYEEAREKLEKFATRTSSSLFPVVDSLEVGPRDSLGRATGTPKRGSFI